MSTRIKVFNYVMAAPYDEATRTLDEARALLATRKSREKSIAASAGAKAAHTVAAKAKVAKAKAKTALPGHKANGTEAKATPVPPAAPAEPQPATV